MSTSPHLQAMLQSEETPIADRNAKGKQFLGFAAIGLAGAVAAYVVLSSGSNGKHRDAKSTEEEFSNITFRPPSFLRDDKVEPAKANQQIVQLPPPPAPVEKADTTAFNVPPPPAPQPVSVSAPPPPTPDAPPVEEEFPERFRSKAVVFDGGAGSGASSGALGAGAAGNGQSVAGDDRNSKYLAAASGLGDRSAKATQIKRIDATVPEGTLIPGILETAVVSDLPGQMRAITSKDVYSFDGRRVLIPAGTRLIGEYQSEVTTGQKRIFVIWTRLIRNDGVSIRLNSIGTDSLGRSGLAGEVDNKWRERFGSAILLSIVGGGASYLTGAGSSGSTTSSSSDRGADLARETIARTFSDMANQTLSKNINIPPTISVNQGERIFIFVRQDLDFSAFYDDPVTEAMRDIQRERRGK